MIMRVLRLVAGNGRLGAVFGGGVAIVTSAAAFGVRAAGTSR
jgi:hypothetical protein